MQTSFSELEYSTNKKQTRRDRFPAPIEAVTPWHALTRVIEPHYPNSGGRGHPPLGLAWNGYCAGMLRGNASAYRTKGQRDKGTND